MRRPIYEQVAFSRVKGERGGGARGVGKRKYYASETPRVVETDFFGETYTLAGVAINGGEHTYAVSDLFSTK